MRLDDLATRLEAIGCPDVLVAEDSLVVRNVVVDPRYGVFVEGVRITEETLDTLNIIRAWQAQPPAPLIDKSEVAELLTKLASASTNYGMHWMEISLGSVDDAKAERLRDANQERAMALRARLNEILGIEDVEPAPPEPPAAPVVTWHPFAETDDENVILTMNRELGKRLLERMYEDQLSAGLTGGDDSDAHEAYQALGSALSSPSSSERHRLMERLYKAVEGIDAETRLDQGFVFAEKIRPLFMIARRIYALAEGGPHDQG